MKKLLTFIVVSLFGGVAFGNPSVGTEPSGVGWNFGNVTDASVSNSLVLNSLSDNYGISQFNTFNTNGKAMQSLGNNDYIPENAVKNVLAIDGYTQAYDYNPQYTGLYASAYNQALPTDVPLTELSFMGLAGNPNAIQNVYVPTSQYNTNSVQGVNGMLDPTTTLNQTVNGNTAAIAQETVRAETVEGSLATGLNQTNAQVNTNTANIGQLYTGLANETNRAQQAEQGLQNQVNGVSGRLDADERLKVMPEAAIRILDTKYMSVVVYDDYDATNGRNFSAGMRYTLKLGKSYEDEKIDAQAKKIKDLEILVNRLTKEVE